MVGCVARYDPQKDHRTLLEAFARLKLSGRSFRLILAGLGCEAGNPALRALIAEFGLQAEAILLGVSPEVERLIARCDALVLSSREGEAMPMVLIEALALGKAVVATDVGGVRETVGDYGLLVPPRDSEALSEALDRVLWREARRWNSVAASAPDYVRKRFPLDALVSRWDELIRRVGTPA
jgi:glycosyltransferase involved in cell wall biosynthesis